MRTIRRAWRALKRRRATLQARMQRTAIRLTEGQIERLDEDIVVQLRYFQG